MKESASKLSTDNQKSNYSEQSNEYTPFGGNITQKKENPFFDESATNPFFDKPTTNPFFDESAINPFLTQTVNDPSSTSPIQKKGIEEEEMQMKEASIQKKENNTGLPENLKTGMENLSGMSMDDVKVNYNSSKPAQLQAHAYAQGTNIEISPGQEQHLPHELAHVVQQKQGRVKPTTQMKGKVNVNDDASLEKEADVMGAKALTLDSPNMLIQQKNKGLESSDVVQKVPTPANQDLTRDKKAEDEVDEIYKKGKYKNKKGAEKVEAFTESGPIGFLGGVNDGVTSSSMNYMKRGDDNTSEMTGATRAFNITGTVGASLSLLGSIATAVKEFGADEKDFDKMFLASLDVAASAGSLISGAAGMASDYTTGSMSSTAANVSGGAFYAEGVINTAKAAYNTIKHIFEAIEAHRGKDAGSDEKYVKSDGKEKFEHTITIFTDLLDLAMGAVKTLHHAASSKFGFLSDSGGLEKIGEAAGGNLMPILSMVMSIIDIAKRVIQLIKAGINKLQIRKKMAAILNSTRSNYQGNNQQNHGVKEIKQSDDNAGFMDKIKTKFDNVKTRRNNNKVLSKGKKSILESNDQKQERKNQTDQLLSDLSDDEKESFKFLQEMDYINGKRQIRASVKIGLDIINIGGEVANMTGVGATAGVALKASSTVGNIGMTAFRKFKQWGRDRAEKQKNEDNAGEAWGFFKAFDTDKSSKNKNEQIKKDVRFIFKQIGSLESSQDDDEKAKKAADIKLYVETTGASFSVFLRKFGVKVRGNNVEQDSENFLRQNIAPSTGIVTDEGIKKATAYLVESMKERE